MAESLSETSGSLEVLEASDEGKKRSKFKAFKSFFGKKKKKGLEDVQGGRKLKTSLSSGHINISAVQSAQEGQEAGHRAKSNMGSRALSHDSIFMLNPEPEGRLYPSPEFLRGRPLQRSYVSRTLPRAGTTSLHGAVSGIVFGTMLPYVPRSEVSAEESKITESSSPLPRQRGNSPPLVRSDSVSKDLEETSVDEESPKSSPKKVSEEIMPLKKSSFEPSTGPVRSQSFTAFAMINSPSSTQLPIGFSTPASTKGCLDSSAARHKMALNPRKQKKSLQMTVSPKQEEPDLPLASEEEKSTVMSKEADQKKPKKDSAVGTGAASLEQSKKTETSSKKLSEQIASLDISSTQCYLSSSVYGRRHIRKGPFAVGISECGIRGKSFKQFSVFSGDFSLEQSPTPPAAAASVTPPEEVSDKDDLGKRNPGTDFKAGKASVAQSVPEDTEGSPVGDPSPCHEDGASGAKKPEARAILPSAVTAAKGFKDPSHPQSEGKEASGSDLQGSQVKMESVQDIPTVGRAKLPGKFLWAFTTSISGPASVLAKRGLSVERQPLRSLSWAVVEPKAEEASSDSESSLELGGGSEQQVAPRPSFLSSEKPKDDQKVFTKPRSSVVEPSRPGQQLPSRAPSRALAWPEAEETSLDSESAPEDRGASEQQVPPRRSLQSAAAAKPDSGQGVSTESKSASEEQVASRAASQASGEPKDKASTESHGGIDKFKSADPSQAWKEKSKDQRGSPSVVKSVLKEWGVSVQRIALKQLPQPFGKPALQQQVSSGLVRVAAQAQQSGSAEHLLSQQPSLSWGIAKAEQQTSSACLERVAKDWGLSLEPLPPRKRLVRLKVEQAASKSPEIATTTGISSAALKRPSKPPLKPTAADTVPAGAESVAIQGSASKHVVPSKGPFRALLRRVVEEEVSSVVESAVVEKNASMQPLGPKHQLPRRLLVQRHVPASPESAAAEGAASGGPLFPKHSAQSLASLRSQQTSQNAGVKEGASALPPRRGPAQPSGSAPAGSGPQEKVPPTHTFQAWWRPKVEREDLARPKSAAVDWGVVAGQLPQRKPSLFRKRLAAERQASSGPVSAPTAQSTPVEPKPAKSAVQALGNRKSMPAASAGPEGTAAEKGVSKEQLPPRMSSQSPMKPVAKQAASAGPESVAAKKEASAEPLPPKQVSRSLVGHKVQQISLNFESAAAEGTVSGKPLPSKNPPQGLVRSKVQEMSSRLENKAREGDTAKKSPVARYPSQSFVKYMTEQVFSESPAAAGGIHADAQSTNPPSKPSVRPKVQFQVFSGQEKASVEGGISSQPLPSKGPLQSSVRPKDPKKVSSQSESAPAKLSGSKEQLPPRYLSQALGKREYQQDASLVSKSTLEEKKSFEDKAPSGGPSQACVFSTGSASAPVEPSRSEKPPPPRSSFWAFAGPKSQRQVHSGSVGAAAEGAVSGSSPSGGPAPKGPASSAGTKKYSHSYDELIKHILALAGKPSKLISAPVSQTSTSGVTCPKEGVVERSEPKNSPPGVSTTKADVENLFGVRLRKVSSLEKSKGEKQGDGAKLSSPPPAPNPRPIHREHRIRRSASHGFLGTEDYSIPGYEFAEKQQSRPKSEILAGNQPTNKVPGKAPGQQAYCSTSEPAWITEMKERQKSSQVLLPKKEPGTKNRATIKEASCAANTFQEGKQVASVFTSNINKPKQMAPKKLFQPTKGGLEDEKPVQEPTTGKEMRRSSTLPTIFQEPEQAEEPIWFSMAKEKSKAWSHMAEIIH